MKSQTLLENNLEQISEEEKGNASDVDKIENQSLNNSPNPLNLKSRISRISKESSLLRDDLTLSKEASRIQLSRGRGSMMS